MQIKEEVILEDIKSLLAQVYPDVEITMDTFLEIGNGSCLDMSSLEIVEFIVLLEQKYDIIIDFEDRYYTVGDAVRGVIGYLTEKEGRESEERCESRL